MRRMVFAVSAATAFFIFPMSEVQAHPLCEKAGKQFKAVCNCHGDNGGTVSVRENGKIVWSKPGGQGSRTGYSPDIDKCIYKLQNR